jgi:hypothetical protein
VALLYAFRDKAYSKSDCPTSDEGKADMSSVPYIAMIGVSRLNRNPGIKH